MGLDDILRNLGLKPRRWEPTPEDFRVPANCTRDEKGRALDPVSKLPIGSIIQNHKGEYGMVLYKRVIVITEELAKKLIAESWPPPLSEERPK